MKETNSKMNYFLSRIFFLIIFIQFINCDIFVYPQYLNQIIDEFRDQPARFGGQLPSNGYRFLAVEGSPANACKEMSPPPRDLNNTDGLKLVVLVARYNCTFEEKIRNAQMAGYDAVIVYNVDSNELEQMSAKNEEGLVIPSVFVGETTAKIILNTYLYNQRFILLINDDLPFNINTHLILPFSIVVGLCFVIMIGFMVVRCVREQRRLRRHRLPKSVLKKIPTVKFNSKGHAYDTCAICLEDYIDGDKLRVLPCAHAYHCKCIDPWLTKSRRVCPICKRRVFVRDGRRRGQPNQQHRRSSDDSLTDSEPDDTTPLINPVENTNHGTFRQISPSEADEPSPRSAQASQSQQQQQQQQPDRRYQRFNPFDRSSASTLTLNNPSNGGGNSLESDQINVWQRFKSYFRRRSLPNDLNQQYDDTTDETSSINAMSNVVTVSPGASAVITPTTSSFAVNLQNRSSSSNNVLNAHLSGSFKDSDDEILDDDDTGHKTIYEPSSHGRPSTSSSLHSAIATIDTETSNVVGRSGVAAIPNTYFNASSSRRNDYNSNVNNQNNSNTNNSNNNNNNNHDIDFIV